MTDESDGLVGDEAGHHSSAAELRAGRIAAAANFAAAPFKMEAAKIIGILHCPGITRWRTSRRRDTVQ
jgi:hypothetical protein